ncbi:hypothetical protein ACFLZM_03290 [Thermodesulfobacteriota bacterium]
MPRKPVKNTIQRRDEVDIADWKMHFLETGKAPSPPATDQLELFFFKKEETQRETWRNSKNQILSAWISNRPGRRPWAWWRYDAPRDPALMAGTAWENRYPIARQQIGGQGVTTPRRYPASLPRFFFGVPSDWHEIDEADPPIFESQAAYLKRHGLLTKAEEKRLKPADFEPEPIQKIIKI